MKGSQVRAVDNENLKSVIDFLSKREDTSQFLIVNLREHGPVLTNHPNSANFKTIFKEQNVSGVFALTRRGNLLVQADPEVADLILRSCESEPVPLKGFIGNWEAVCELLKQHRN